MFPSSYGASHGTRFLLSETGGQAIQFEINPSEYDPYPPLEYRVIPVASGFPLVNSDVYDNRVMTMKFQVMSSGFYRALEHFARRTTWTDGQLTQLTFSDGDLGAFTNAPIKIINLTGQPRTGLSGISSALKATVNASATSIEATDMRDFPAAGRIRIEQEDMTYTAWTINGNTQTFDSVTRGIESIAAAHTVNGTTLNLPIFPVPQIYKPIIEYVNVELQFISDV